MNVLFIAIHADDEVVGCVGTIAREDRSIPFCATLTATRPTAGLP